MPTDTICEDCEDFIYFKCVKKDHKDHDWDIITSDLLREFNGWMKIYIVCISTTERNQKNV